MPYGPRPGGRSSDPHSTMPVMFTKTYQGDMSWKNKWVDSNTPLLSTKWRGGSKESLFDNDKEG